MKLLILAYDFPPFISIGALRPYSWYKYLSDFGADVTVVTRDWEYDEAKGGGKQKSTSPISITEHNGKKTLVKVRFSPGIKEQIIAKLNADKFVRLRKPITYLFSFLEYLSLRFDSKAALYYEADKLMQTEKFDFIIATGKPFILFRYASLLSKKHKTAWIADYRDSWTLNHEQSDYSLDLLNYALNCFYKIAEKNSVSTARIITTVAPSYLEVMPPFVKRENIEVVYNGYDNDIETAVEGIIPPNNKFIISYAGVIYPMQRLETFLEGVDLFLKEREMPPAEFEIHFWGVEQIPGTVGRIINYRQTLQKYIHIHDKTGYFDVMKKISGSHILLLLTSNSDRWLNAKLFDYLVLNRPVLMVGSKTNIMSTIMGETNAGMVVENAAGVAEYIAAQFSTYRVSTTHKTVNYQQYSRKNQAEKLYLVLKKLMA